ncbi:DUF7226 domain-containing protein [Lactiplantibacillus plajomi]|uniref:DUF7226 domain-containing protein n=1 Tax=Lactiplantibacillus plajomi TaxID=1457217 RepID=A0ABV6K156_9LACO|nr:hypothetical protein [Lactiplantibacillus plajomi]
MNSIKLRQQYKFSLSSDPKYIYNVGDTQETLLSAEDPETFNKLVDNQPILSNYPVYANKNTISFPQANNLQIALDYLSLLAESDNYITASDDKIPSSSSEAFVDAFKYNQRQYNYYLNLLGYLHLVDYDLNKKLYVPTTLGQKIATTTTHERYTLLLKEFSEHLSFRAVLKKLIKHESLDNNDIIAAINTEMLTVPLKSQISDSTLPRRVSSIKSLCKQVLKQLGLHV